MHVCVKKKITVSGLFVGLTILTILFAQDGGLFTFGNGSRGQLGHDSTNNEPLPRRVLELMGTEVSQIACGRYAGIELMTKINDGVSFIPFSLNCCIQSKGVSDAFTDMQEHVLAMNLLHV